jgi:hypothetical protein
MYTYAPQLTGAQYKNISTVHSLKNRYLKAYETCKIVFKLMILITVKKQRGKLETCYFEDVYYTTTTSHILYFVESFK